MTEQTIDAEAVLADLKDFQRRTARWAFERMFAEKDPALRFLVADEVGLGKTHVAKGVIAQVIKHLRDTGDKRQDIVYICSNGAIARQNIRKLVPAGIDPVENVDRLTMLPLARLDRGGATAGINLLPITPGTSLKFGRSTGRFRERCLAYTFLRTQWGKTMRTERARRVFWEGVNPKNGDGWLRWWEREYRPQVADSLKEFAKTIAEADSSRLAAGRPTLRTLFDEIVSDMPKRHHLPFETRERRKDFIGAVRSIMAHVGISRLNPDLIILDEFQRFKDLLHPELGNFAAELAHRLFDHSDTETGRSTRTLLLSATPYRMYTTGDDIEDDHYKDFLDTCSFLLQSPERVGRLQNRFKALRRALTSTDPLDGAQRACRKIEDELRSVMARTERLAATPDRDGMLQESDPEVAVKPSDLHAYLRFSSLAETVKHHDPAEYWKSGPYLINFMEGYKFKEAVTRAAVEFSKGAEFEPGPGLLDWDDVEAYERVDPQNGRLRWLLDDLAQHRAFELLWVPPSLRYYDTGSVYESPEALGFTKRLIFSGWTVVPKVVSSLVSFEAERRAFAGRDHSYTDDYRRRGGQRLAFRTTERTSAEARRGEADGPRRAAAMTSFLLTWPSPSLAELGDPRPRPPNEHNNTGAARGEADDASSYQQLSEGARAEARGERPSASDLLVEVTARVRAAVDSLVRAAPTTGPIDRRWYWAAPLFLDRQRHPGATDFLLGPDGASYWEEEAGQGLTAHVAEARAMVDYGRKALGRPPDDLAEVLAELAVGGPAQCALRAISAVTGLAVTHQYALWNAAWIGAAFRGFFNAPEVTAVVLGTQSNESESPHTADSDARYWRDVVRHSISGNLQTVLDEHLHVLRDWLGYLTLHDDERRGEAAAAMGYSLGEALDLRTSAYRVDVPGPATQGDGIEFEPHRMRARFAVAFGNQRLEDDSGEARVESVSRAFNSPFWPFVLASTSIGQEGLDFHLWCHSVVHWNLPYNPVDLEQREGRVHRYKGHAVRRNIASTLGSEMLAGGSAASADRWEELFAKAADTRRGDDSEMVPYWVFNQGPAKIERHVPVMPFSHEAAALPRLRKTLAAYRLAFGQPRQEELVEFLGSNLSAEDLERLRIDLSPPDSPTEANK